MVATKAVLRRIYVRQIAILLVGVLCGAIIAEVVETIDQPHHHAVAPQITVTMPYSTTDVVSGRLGGITSSDTANDRLIRQTLSRESQTPAAEESMVIGGRLGGLESADAPTDAAIKRSLQREIGPGEGLNPVP
jgi:hypothetical protein